MGPSTRGTAGEHGVRHRAFADLETLGIDRDFHVGYCLVRLHGFLVLVSGDRQRVLSPAPQTSCDHRLTRTGQRRLAGPSRRHDSLVSTPDDPAIGRSEYKDRILPELGA